MRKMFSKMWKDDAGVVALEYLLVATVLSMALVVGLSAVSGAINAELTELANAILALDQGYSVVAQSTCDGFHAGTVASGTQLAINYGHSTLAQPQTAGVNVGTTVSVCP